jgi:hypothetical protein
MQDKNGDRRGESAVSKGQSSRIALHDSRTGAVPLRKPNDGHLIVFKTGDVPDAFSQFGGSRAWPSPDLQEVLAQL